MITIHTNGSKWAGEQPDPLEKLFEVLKNHTLEPDLEDCGNFVHEKLRSVHFLGNFFDISHAFDIETDEPELMEKLFAAIRANKNTEEYQRCKRIRKEQDDKFRQTLQAGVRR